MAEINGLLNRRTGISLYRGFESLPHRKRILHHCALSNVGINEMDGLDGIMEWKQC